MADEVNDVNTPVETQETTTPASSTEETKAPEVASETSKLWDNPDESTAPKEEAEEKPEEPKEPKAPEEPESEEQPQGKAEERKQQLNTEIRDLVSQRNTLKQEVEKLNAEVYQPKTVQELVEEGMSETDAKVAALEQREELREFNNQVVEAQLFVGSESEKIIRDFPIFDDQSDKYKPEIAAQAAELLEANLIRDPNVPEIDKQTGQPTGLGQVIGYRMSPYQLYKPIADAYAASAVEGQIQGQKATAEMLARTDAPSSTVPREAKTDPLMELWSK